MTQQPDDRPLLTPPQPVTTTRVESPVQTPVGRSATGAVPVKQRRRRGGFLAGLADMGWIRAGLAILGVLLLAVLISLLVNHFAGGDSNSSGTDNGSAASTGTGSLAAGSTQLLGSDAAIGQAVGQQATGSNVLVQSVVADEGFWVGSDAQHRDFVYLTPSARGGSGESGYQVRAGDRIDLSGTVQKAPQNFASQVGVTADEGAEQLQHQGAYIAATRVALHH